MKDLSKFGIPEIIRGYKPPFIANILGKRWVLLEECNDWIEVDNTVELEDLRERWIKNNFEQKHFYLKILLEKYLGLHNYHHRLIDDKKP